MGTRRNKNTRLSKLFIDCRTRKCSKYIKKRNIEDKHFAKEFGLKFYPKSNKTYWNRLRKLNGLSKEIVKCSHTKCAKERKELNKLRPNPLFQV